MADEITLNFQLIVNNGNFVDRINPPALRFDQSTIGVAGGVQIIDYAGETAIDLGDLSVPGLAYFRNLDVANFVDLGPTESATMISATRLYPGQVAIMPLVPGKGYNAQADTAAVKLDVRIYET